MLLASVYLRGLSPLFLSVFVLLCCLLGLVVCESSIYEVLKVHGLPMGVLPKGVKNFTVDNSGKFLVHLDQACNAKFENEIHYDKNVSGTISFGLISDVSGISAQDLFLWFRVKEIRVDVPSSGLIYFDVGVVSKKFSLSSFETPRDCIAVQLPHDQSQNIDVELQYKLVEHEDSGRAVL